MSFAKKILNWYYTNKRDLPWRHTKDPYKIWLSEIIMQQTRIDQGLPYYQKFVDQYPTVKALAMASEESVLKLWQGLGYYSRARNLHATAKEIYENQDSTFPASYKLLRELRGIGDYTASALMSICFDQPEPVVDGNVYRLLGRYFGIATPINTSQGSKEYKSLAQDLMPDAEFGNYNQAIMEFGAIQCKPQNPDCQVCPLQQDCLAYNTNSVRDFPVKIASREVKIRYFNYLFVVNPIHKTIISKREGKGIWRNLYEFPLLESKKTLNLKQVKNRIPERIKINSLQEIMELNDTPIIHKLSHQHLYSKFWLVKTQDDLSKGIYIKNLDQFPFPVLLSDFIKTLKNSYF
jgi:A/G-specific adenine glycosylase